MASLQTYLEAAKSAILAGAYDRGILICHHVLDHYPKHIEAHCLLGEAYREKGLAELAETYFLRVLSADPENLIARWALSVMAEERGDSEAAAAHMQRAYDVNPRHPEVRKELSRLLGRRARLGSAGLARLYLQQGLMWPAINELRAEVATEGDRLDVRVALAEALWRVGERDEAAMLCRGILEDSPDCLKANIMLAHLCLEQGGASSASVQELLETAQALDPENATANDLLPRLGTESSLARRTIELPSIEGEEKIVVLEETGEVAEPEAAPGHGSSRAVVEPAPWQAAPAPMMREEVHEKGRGNEVEPVERIVSDVRPPAVGLPVEATVRKADDGPDRVAADARGDVSAAAVHEERVREEPVWLESIASGYAPTEPVERDLRARDRSAHDLGAHDPGAVEGQTPKLDNDQLLAEFGEEWASLLTEDIQLDAESEARLEAALAEVKMESLEPGWRHTVSPLSSGFLEREESADRSVERPVAQTAGVYEGADQANLSRSPAALLAEAVKHQEAGLVDQAIEEYSELLRVAPELSEEIAGRLKLVVQSQPEHGRAHRVLGDAYMKLGRFQLAIEEYNWILKRGAEGQ